MNAGLNSQDASVYVGTAKTSARENIRPSGAHKILIRFARKIRIGLNVTRNDAKSPIMPINGNGMKQASGLHIKGRIPKNNGNMTSAIIARKKHLYQSMILPASPE